MNNKGDLKFVNLPIYKLPLYEKKNQFKIRKMYSQRILVIY